MTALIITPIGIPVPYDEKYDAANHWRLVKPGRSYEVLAVPFSDFQPEPGTYDWIRPRKGLKWNMLVDIANDFDWSKYDYIGYWDDDYVSDIRSVNRALELGRQYDMTHFQMSLTSWTVYPCLEHNPDWIVSSTNFIELGVPFFRGDIFERVLEFLTDYKYVKSDWGIDKVLSYYLQANAFVIHDVSIFHSRRESHYSKEDGFREMHYLMHEFFPKYMKEKFNIEYQPYDQQVTFQHVTKSGEIVTDKVGN